MSEIMGMSGLEQMSVVDGRGANRGRKRLIVHVGLGLIVLLLIIDIILLVLFFTAKSKNDGKATMAAARRRLRHTVGVVNRADDDEAYFLLEDVSASPLNTTFRLQPETLCNTSGCVWLQGYLRPQGSIDGEGLYRSVRAAGPCDDFHEHVCGKQRHSVYMDGVTRLMNAVKVKVAGQSEDGHVTRGGQESTGRESNAEQGSKLNYGGVLKRCLKGEAVVMMDDVFRACVDTDDGTCPKSLPDVPLRITEDYFRENPYASVTDYASFIERIVPNVHLNQVTHLDAAGVPNASSGSPLASACRLVVQSARCHFQQNGRLKNSAELDLYLLIWKLLYFAPLLGNQFGELMALAYKQPPDARLQACLRIGEDMFRRETVEMVRAVLAEAVPSVKDRVLNFIWEAREVMRLKVSVWMERADGVNDTGDDAPKKTSWPAGELASEQLATLDAVIGTGSNVTHPHVSLYSWQMRYMEDGKTLFVPPGLLGLLINVSSSILDPVLVPILGRVVIHEMMPKRRGLYAWSGRHQLRFDKVVDCLVSDLNVAGTERDVRDLSTKTALEFGALEPLLMLYKRRLLEVLGRGVRLHSDYSNAQVFFVLWALGHCGERDADALVNTVLRNSALFARAFQCSVNHAMWLQKPCSFWN